MRNWHKVYKPKWLIEVLKMFKSLSVWVVVQNYVFINQEQSVLAKQLVQKVHVATRSSAQQQH